MDAEIFSRYQTVAREIFERKLEDRRRIERRQAVQDFFARGRRVADRRKKMENNRLLDWERRFHKARGSLQI